MWDGMGPLEERGVTCHAMGCDRLVWGGVAWNGVEAIA